VAEKLQSIEAPIQDVSEDMASMSSTVDQATNSWNEFNE
jgi:hypothetical protein